MKLWAFVALATLINAPKIWAQTNVQPPRVVTGPMAPAQPYSVYGVNAQYVDLGQFQLPQAPCYVTDPEGRIVAVVPPASQTQPFMQKLNSGIPGWSGASAMSNNTLTYGYNSCGGSGMPVFQPPQMGQQAPPPMPSAFPGLNQLMNQFNRNPAYDQAQSQGGGFYPESMLSGGGGSSGGGGTGYNGPNHMCVKTEKSAGAPQFKQRPPNNESWCDVIRNAITDQTKGVGCMPSNAELAKKIGESQTADGKSDIEDMEKFCPGWEQIRKFEMKRTMFLMNFIAAIVPYESSWNPETVGDVGKLANGDVSSGLLQLTKRTDAQYGCACRTMNVKDPVQNLQCGTRMILTHIARDSSVGAGGINGPVRGVARSWGPFRDKNRNGVRTKIMEHTAAYCRGIMNLTPQPEVPPPVINRYPSKNKMDLDFQKTQEPFSFK